MPTRGSEEESKRRDGFTVKIKGKGPGLTLDELLSGMDTVNALWRATCERVTGDPDAVGLKIVGFHFVCDGCGRRRPEEYGDWVQRDGNDYCPNCKPWEQEALDFAPPEENKGREGK